MRHSRLTITALTLASSMLVAAPAAVAQEYCVVCTEPNAIYRCVIEDARPGLATSLQMSCATALAKDGQHSQCAVKRAVTVFECDGPIKKISASQAGMPANQASPSVVVAPPPPPAKSPDEPPATVEEAAKRAKQATDKSFKDTGEQLQKAGEATGSFFKKTLSCIGSLFTRCDG